MSYTQIKATHSAIKLVAIRGAVQVDFDTTESIASSTLLMIDEIISNNHLSITDFVSLFFTVTPDLTTELPPLVLYESGIKIPSLCAVENNTSMMIPRVIRVMAHVQWPYGEQPHKHIYLPGTISSRPFSE
ncbi:chorismate mutase [Xenorhabdus szentirmaii]|uniref:chorismate mutase n=2 Tax=Xenorhabdus szentirmaii TaxID=290112 RepID=W1IYU9_9GAMM|nr:MULTISPECIES: chorismate mutase [Xenorhabdus]MBD2798901.1 chorismate mutase [Xenorhabdus sp. M]PHM30457.1 Chorismate mutase AroH [Xenorhabdus szentirmaii DSM 16338]CDL83629.1 Chorismate mutase [Xenorhabdus szentirmaii DSM 16338]